MSDWKPTDDEAAAVYGAELVVAEDATIEVRE